MLATEDLTLHYGLSKILYGISIQASLGKITCIMGSNGVGKTSLLRVLSGTHPSSGGRYLLDGSDVTNKRPDTLAKAGVAYVPQGRFIFPLLTVRENMETGFACLPRKDHFISEEIFELVPALRAMMDRRGGDLSGGQQQQLAIARALITNPKLLLLDEPTEGIQPNIITHIGEVIVHLRQQKQMSIILVEQYFDFAFGLADHIYAMTRGKIVYDCLKTKADKTQLRDSVGV